MSLKYLSSLFERKPLRGKKMKEIWWKEKKVTFFLSRSLYLWGCYSTLVKSEIESDVSEQHLANLWAADLYFNDRRRSRKKTGTPKISPEFIITATTIYGRHHHVCIHMFIKCGARIMWAIGNTYRILLIIWQNMGHMLNTTKVMQIENLGAIFFWKS